MPGSRGCSTCEVMNTEPGTGFEFATATPGDRYGAYWLHDDGWFKLFPPPKKKQKTTMNDEMTTWINERLTRSRLALEAAERRHDQLRNWKEQIADGRPSLACQNAFTNWQSLQPKLDTHPRKT